MANYAKDIDDTVIMKSSRHKSDAHRIYRKPNELEIAKKNEAMHYHEDEDDKKMVFYFYYYCYFYFFN